VAGLQNHGLCVAGINVDGWLNLPDRRFGRDNPAEHFYEHALRLDEMFEQLVLPLRRRRGHRVVADFAEETATAFRPHTYHYENVDVIVLEGIYVFKRAYRSHFDLALWIDCTFATALERAIRLQILATSLGAPRPIPDHLVEPLHASKYREEFLDEYWRYWVRRVRSQGLDRGMPA
jgi:hypothetical protein